MRFSYVCEIVHIWLKTTPYQSKLNWRRRRKNSVLNFLLSWFSRKFNSTQVKEKKVKFTIFETLLLSSTKEKKEEPTTLTHEHSNQKKREANALKRKKINAFTQQEEKKFKMEISMDSFNFPLRIYNTMYFDTHTRTHASSRLCALNIYLFYSEFTSNWITWSHPHIVRKSREHTSTVCEQSQKGRQTLNLLSHSEFRTHHENSELFS